MSDNSNDLEARVEGLEKIVGRATKKTEPDDIPLHVLNRRHREVLEEEKAKNRDALSVATEALAAAFGGKGARRERKAIARHAVEQAHASIANRDKE